MTAGKDSSGRLQAARYDHSDRNRLQLWVLGACYAVLFEFLHTAGEPRLGMNSPAPPPFSALLRMGVHPPPVLSIPVGLLCPLVSLLLLVLTDTKHRTRVLRAEWDYRACRQKY
jgi:hypothetical protein